MFDHQNIRNQVQTLWQRTRDSHLRIGVTGLSGCGKTAFITGLIHQLEHAARDASLPHWHVAFHQRLLGVKQTPQIHPQIPSFGYANALAQLSKLPPQWPESTRSISEIRLEIRYRSHGLLKQKLDGEFSRLFIDLVDYPGEWLLDLPLLSLSYDAWSQQIVQQLQTDSCRASLASGWMETMWTDSEQAQVRDTQITDVASRYTDYLKACKHEYGYSSIQPGRFVLPGEFADAPLLRFVPWVWSAPASESHQHIYREMAQRFEAYKEHVVRQFYRTHFSSFDRQIVLVDALSPLMRNDIVLRDMQTTLTNLLQSFQYGKSNWFRRLFAPKIDKLIFAATKADHVTPEQHPHLLNLVQELLQQSAGHAKFEGIDVACMAIASIKSSEYHQVTYEGKPLSVLHGVTLQEQEIAMFPGAVPDRLSSFSARQTPLQIPTLRPPIIQSQQMYSHIRIDQVLEFLTGDKLS